MNIEAFDDLATAKPPYKVIACFPVWGRVPLLRQSIKRLYQKNGCHLVICSGDRPEDKAACEESGAIWVHHNNRFLGAKWNSAFLKAKEYNPDAVLFVGSSDWVGNDWIRIMRPYVDQYGFAGTAGTHLADIGETMRLVYWPGYADCRPERGDECIGSGRMLSRRLLDALGWQPFRDNYKKSLDWSMKDSARRKGYHDFMVNDPRLISMSLSTSAWTNLHKFEEHWDETHPRYAKSIKLEPEPFLSTYFPEIYKIFPNEIKRDSETLQPAGQVERL